jgi:HAD superfamily hydrolase (TIGR01509 family)
MLKALLFDLDDTLAETTSVHHQAWAKALRPYGYDITREFYRDKFSGRLPSEVISDLLPGLSPEEGQALLEAKEADFRERAQTLKPVPGLVGFIASSRKKGVKASLVTNAPKENVLAVLRILGLDNGFNPVILAEEVGVGKPDPVPYQAALETLGISADETVAFEDSPSGIASSVAAGIPNVGIASTQDPEKLEGLGVDLVVRDFTDPKLRAFIEER